MEPVISALTAIAEGLFAEEPEPYLIGGRDRETGRIVFPCPGDESRWAPVALPPRGTLWSWTIQCFRPKSPPYVGSEAFEPFAVGYVELPGAVIVEARLTDVPFDGLRIGLSVETVLIPVGDESAPRRTFAFRPAAQAHR